MALSQVPEGRIVSYGELARIAGLPRGARRAARALSELPKGSGLPWHRVLNAQGRIALPEGSRGYREQARLLRGEGVEVRGGRVVRPSRYFWHGGPD